MDICVIKFFLELQLAYASSSVTNTENVLHVRNLTNMHILILLSNTRNSKPSNRLPTIAIVLMYYDKNCSTKINNCIYIS